jgi:hypothetical protein
MLVDDVLAVQEVEPLRGLADVADQLPLRDARVPRLAALLQPGPQRAVRQFHDDVQAVVVNPEILGGE